MSGNKIESGKKGKFLRILTSHYRLIIFILMWSFLTLLWFAGPENTNPELRYFDVILFCSIVLGLFFVFVEILKQIPKIIRKIKETFGKDSGDKRGFFEKSWEVISYSPASFFLFICFIVAVMFGIAACLEPFIFAETLAGTFIEHLFVIVAVMFVLSMILIIFVSLLLWLL